MDRGPKWFARCAKCVETSADNLELALELSNPELMHLEFGVFNGSSLTHMALYAPTRRFWGFDSFEGLPEEWDKGNTILPRGHLTMGGTMPEGLPANVTLVPGLFQKTLIPFLYKGRRKKVGFVHIDSDLYSSAKYVLGVVEPFLVSGAMIVFDELVDWEGVAGGKITYPTWAAHEWRALEEWSGNFAKAKPVSRTRRYQGTVCYVGR